MFGMGVSYLREVSEPPIPFISTGKSQKVRTDRKTTFSGEFSVALPVIWVATRPKDIESWLDYLPKSRWSGNRSLGYVLGLGSDGFG